MGFRRIGGPLVEFIRFSPRVMWFEVPNHQYKYYGVVLDEFHDEFLGMVVKKKKRRKMLGF